MYSIKVILVCIISMVVLHGSDKIYVKFIGSVNPAGGMHTWVDRHTVLQNGKKCIYEYSVGVMQGIIKNTCTGESHTFPVRDDKPYAKPYKYKIQPVVDPYFYQVALKFLVASGHKAPTDKTIVSQKNSKGIKIFCYVDLKTCTTENEILTYIHRGYKLED